MKPKRYGPYPASGGHLFWIDVYPDGARKSVFVHREMMEEHLGRKLAKSEVVHHRNETPDDNWVGNFEVKSRGAHTKDHRVAPAFVSFVCAWCGAEGVKLARQLRSNQSVKGRKGPFCNKSCAGKWSRQQQIQDGHRNLRSNMPP